MQNSPHSVATPTGFHHSESLFATLEHSPFSVLVTDADGQVEYVNHHFVEHTGYQPSEIIGRKPRQVVGSGETPEECYIKLWERLKSGNTWHGSFINRTKQGLVYTENATIIPIQTGNITTHYLSIQHDISHLLQDMQLLKMHQSTFRHAQVGMLISDHNNNIISVNPIFTEVTGYTEEEVIGKSPRLLSSGLMSADFYRAMWEKLGRKDRWSGEIINRRKNGDVYVEWLSIGVVRNEQGEILYHIATLTDITERKEEEERLNHLVRHDTLTGLPNRTFLQERIQEEIARAQRCGNRFAILFLDFDRFKSVNDTLGHHYGDLLLQQAAQRITARVRSYDFVCRHGGDEFVLVLPDLNSEENASHIAEELVQTLGAPYLIQGHEVCTPVSLGIALYPNDGETSHDLLKNADLSMYEAKHRGGNCHHFHTPDMNVRAMAHHSIETKLRHALERNEFTLHYQPLVDLSSGKIASAEVLLRWQHQDLTIHPVEFIPVAEETGLIVPIGEWVMLEAARQHQAWRDAALPAPRLAVNLSAAQFHQPELCRKIAQTLERFGMPANQFEIEVTESVAIAHPQRVTRILEELREMHISIALDDFGTGYSSLSYLRHLPLDKLKIDRSFVQEIMHNHKDVAIICAITKMAQTLGMQVVAEGIEDEKQLQQIVSCGCDFGQGYLFSKPVSAADFSEMLAARHAYPPIWLK